MCVTSALPKASSNCRVLLGRVAFGNSRVAVDDLVFERFVFDFDELAASVAISSVVAATAATICPTYWTSLPIAASSFHTAFTPGSFSAALPSMLTTSARGCGEVTTLAQSMPGG